MGHPRTADAMQHLHVLLCDRLDRHGQDLRACHRRTDYRCIIGIVLLAQHERIHMLRRQQPRPMIHHLRLSAPLQASMPTSHGDSSRKQGSNCARRTGLRTSARPERPHGMYPDHLLCQFQSNTSNVRDELLLLCDWSTRFQSGT
jgi:hypothetical protein